MKTLIRALTCSALIVSIASTPLAAIGASGSERTNTELNQRLNQGNRLPIQGQAEVPSAKSMPMPKLPNAPLHTFYLVEVNKRGQVAKIRAGSPSSSDPFNTMTYYNALQTFVRKTDGSATAGVFRLNYDYNPSTHNVKRDVLLVHKGGVDPNAPGAVERMAITSADNKKTPSKSR